MTALVLSVLLAATPSPAPTSTDVSPTLGSPGLAGFVATFAIAVGVIVIVRMMVRSLRRVNRAPDPADDEPATGERR